MQNEKFRYILYFTHLITCGAPKHEHKSMTPEQVHSNVQEIKALLKTLEFDEDTVECVRQNVVKGTIYDIFCAVDRQENLSDFLDFLVSQAKAIFRQDFADDKYKRLIDIIVLGADLIKLIFKKFLFEYTICPEKEPKWFTFPSKKIRRQYGVKDMLHTLEIMYCNQVVVEGYGNAIEDRFRSNFLSWTNEVNAKFWCCLVQGEWNHIV